MAGEDALLGAVVGGRYRIERLLERGGMGAIYEAVQEPLGRRVALKVLHSHLSDDPIIVERFRREAEACARLRHPNVVQVTDYQAEAGETAFLVMELVEGRPLADVMRTDGILPPTRAVHITMQLLDALSAAHAEGVIHRDLKPTNVLVSSSGALEDVVTVLDFGIAKLADPTGAEPKRLTKQGMLVGTPAYMAPEQARGEEVDERADVYGAGVLLYAMLAGRLPFPQKDRGEVLRAILRDTPPKLIEVRPDLDPGLAGAVDRAIARDREDRWQTADEMRRELFRWQRRAGGVLQTPTVPAPPPDEGKGGDGRRMSMRKWVFFAGILGSAVAGAALAWSLSQSAEPATPSAAVAGGAARADVPDAEPVPEQEAEQEVEQEVEKVPVEPELPRDPEASETPTTVQRPAEPAPARSAREPRGTRLEVMTAAGDRLYEAGPMNERLRELSAELSECTREQDVPDDAAPPVWYLDVTAAGGVRSVRTSMGEWPLAVANCVTRSLRDLELGPTRTGDGGQVVLSVAVR